MNLDLFLKSRSPSLYPHYRDFFATMAPSDFLDNLNGISLLAYIHKFKSLPKTSHGHVPLSPIHPVSNHTHILLTALSPNPSPISIKASTFVWRVARYKCHHEFTFVTGWMFAILALQILPCGKHPAVSYNTRSGNCVDRTLTYW